MKKNFQWTLSYHISPSMVTELSQTFRNSSAYKEVVDGQYANLWGVPTEPGNATAAYVIQTEAQAQVAVKMIRASACPNILGVDCEGYNFSHETIGLCRGKAKNLIGLAGLEREVVVSAKRQMKAVTSEPRWNFYRNYDLIPECINAKRCCTLARTIQIAILEGFVFIIDLLGPLKGHIPDCIAEMFHDPDVLLLVWGETYETDMIRNGTDFFSNGWDFTSQLNLQRLYGKLIISSNYSYLSSISGEFNLSPAHLVFPGVTKAGEPRVLRQHHRTTPGLGTAFFLTWAIDISDAKTNLRPFGTFLLRDYGGIPKVELATQYFANDAISLIHLLLAMTKFVDTPLQSNPTPSLHDMLEGIQRLTPYQQRLPHLSLIAWVNPQPRSAQIIAIYSDMRQEYQRETLRSCQRECFHPYSSFPWITEYEAMLPGPGTAFRRDDFGRPEPLVIIIYEFKVALYWNGLRKRPKDQPGFETFVPTEEDKRNAIVHVKLAKRTRDRIKKTIARLRIEQGLDSSDIESSDEELNIDPEAYERRIKASVRVERDRAIWQGIEPTWVDPQMEMLTLRQPPFPEQAITETEARIIYQVDTSPEVISEASPIALDESDDQMDTNDQQPDSDNDDDDQPPPASGAVFIDLAGSPVATGGGLDQSQGPQIIVGSSPSRVVVRSAEEDTEAEGDDEGQGTDFDNLWSVPLEAAVTTLPRMLVHTPETYRQRAEDAIEGFAEYRLQPVMDAPEVQTVVKGMQILHQQQEAQITKEQVQFATAEALGEPDVQTRLKRSQLNQALWEKQRTVSREMVKQIVQAIKRNANHYKTIAHRGHFTAAWNELELPLGRGRVRHTRVQALSPERPGSRSRSTTRTGLRRPFFPVIGGGRDNPARTSMGADRLSISPAVRPFIIQEASHEVQEQRQHEQQQILAHLRNILLEPTILPDTVRIIPETVEEDVSDGEEALDFITEEELQAQERRRLRRWLESKESVSYAVTLQEYQQNFPMINLDELASFIREDIEQHPTEAPTGPPTVQDTTTRLQDERRRVQEAGGSVQGRIVASIRIPERHLRQLGINNPTEPRTLAAYRTPSELADHLALMLKEIHELRDANTDHQRSFALPQRLPYEPVRGDLPLHFGIPNPENLILVTSLYSRFPWNISDPQRHMGRELCSLVAKQFLTSDGTEVEPGPPTFGPGFNPEFATTDRLFGLLADTFLFILAECQRHGWAYSEFETLCELLCYNIHTELGQVVGMGSDTGMDPKLGFRYSTSLWDYLRPRVANLRDLFWEYRAAQRAINYQTSDRSRMPEFLYRCRQAQEIRQRDPIPMPDLTQQRQRAREYLGLLSPGRVIPPLVAPHPRSRSRRTRSDQVPAPTIIRRAPPRQPSPRVKKSDISVTPRKRRLISRTGAEYQLPSSSPRPPRDSGFGRADQRRKRPQSPSPTRHQRRSPRFQPIPPSPVWDDQPSTSTGIRHIHPKATPEQPPDIALQRALLAQYDTRQGVQPRAAKRRHRPSPRRSPRIQSGRQPSSTSSNEGPMDVPQPSTSRAIPAPPSTSLGARKRSETYQPRGSKRRHERLKAKEEEHDRELAARRRRHQERKDQDAKKRRQQRKK